MAQKVVSGTLKIAYLGLDLESLTRNLLSSSSSASFVFDLILMDKMYRKAFFGFIYNSGRSSYNILANYMRILNEEQVLQILKFDKDENSSKVLRYRFKAIFDHFPSILLDYTRNYELFPSTYEYTTFYYQNHSISEEEHEAFLKAKKELITKFNSNPENPLLSVIGYLHNCTSFDRKSEFRENVVGFLVRAALIKQDKEFFLKMLKLLEDYESNYPAALIEALLTNFVTLEEVYLTSSRILSKLMSHKLSMFLSDFSDCEALSKIVFENYDISKTIYPTIGLRDAIESRDLSIIKDYKTINTILHYFALNFVRCATPDEKVVENAAFYLEKMKLIVPRDILEYQIKVFFSKLGLKAIAAILSKVLLTDYSFKFPQFSTDELVGLVRNQQVCDILWPFRNRLYEQNSMLDVPILLENYQEAYNYVTFMDPTLVERTIGVSESIQKDWLNVRNDTLIRDSILARYYR